MGVEYSTGLGERLAAAIKASGKSRQQIADEAVTTKSQISRILHGANWTFDLLERIAIAAKTTVGYLVGTEHALSPADDAQIDSQIDWLRSKQARIAPRANAVILNAARGSKRSERSRRIPAGVSIVAERSPDRVEIDIPSRYRQLGTDLVARALDDSMIEAGILQGDFVFGIEDSNIATERIVICRHAGGTYIKRLVVQGDRARLLSANPKSLTIDAALSDIQQIAIVVGRSGDVADHFTNVT